MSVLRTGILGCGGFAHRHAEIIANLPDELELVAFADRNEPKAQAFREQYAPNAQVFTTHRAMFESAQLDLVIICLPPYGHTDEVELAAEAGIHLLIEKPIALSSEAAWRMVEAAEKRAIKTQVGFMFRFGEAIEQFKALQTSGQTGAIGLMSARYFCNALHAPWWRVREKSGGQLVEQVIHMFDLLRYFMGDAVSVYSKQANIFHQDVPDYTIEDTSATIISFAHGGLGVIYATNNAIPQQWINDYRIVAQHFTADFQSANQASFYPTQAANQSPILVNSDRDFRREQIIDLIHAIRTNGVTRTPLREGAKTLDLVLAASRAAQQQTEVHL
jgi:predicted dehydrogenase